MPIEGVVTCRWKEKVFEQVNGETKINRRYYELCVLEKLERVEVQRSVGRRPYDFRNPSEDLPGDWSDEQRRMLHYQDLGSLWTLRRLRGCFESEWLPPSPISTVFCLD